MAKEINTRLMSILESEFQRIRDRENAPEKYKTIGDMAIFLGILPSAMSHYRNSNRFLGRTTARDLANRLRSDHHGGRAEERETLAEQLYAARPVGADTEAAAQEWLRGIGNPGHLLLVEFRDFPSARPYSTNRAVSDEMAKEAGQAVARGLHYALLNPFPRSFQNLVSVPAHLKNYINSIEEAINGTYQRILAETYYQVVCDHQNTKTEALEKSLNSAKKRLRVYRWQNDISDAQSCAITSCPGLGYKLFYHREGDKTPEIWQWLSTDNGERLLQKKADEQEIAAIECRFYPIRDFFEEKRISEEEAYLPSNDELKHFADLNSGNGFDGSPWEELPMPSDKINNKLIDNAKRRYQ
jgi:hypothetical protein